VLLVTPRTMSTTPEIESLWRASSARLCSWFERETGSAADAEDLVQETFLRVHERLDTLLDAASIRAWLGRIARNVLVDHHRRCGAAGATEPVEDELAPAPDGSNLDGVVASWLEGFLGEIDPLDAEALRVVDLEGRTQRELAELQGLSLSGAKSRVQRARAKLRARLEACCTFAQDARGGILEARRRADGRCAEGCE
jgi:RNA polymerase sigma-70 factor (ECF subfamily)